MIRRTYTTTGVYGVAPCGHKVPVPNDAYGEPIELDACDADVRPAGAPEPGALPLDLPVAKCGRRWIVSVIEGGAGAVARFVRADAGPVAAAFHEVYEALAPDLGYETREASRAAWAAVPLRNRALMLEVVATLLDRGVIDVEHDASPPAPDLQVGDRPLTSDELAVLAMIPPGPVSSDPVVYERVATGDPVKIVAAQRAELVAAVEDVLYDDLEVEWGSIVGRAAAAEDVVDAVLRYLLGAAASAADAAAEDDRIEGLARFAESLRTRPGAVAGAKAAQRTPAPAWLEAPARWSWWGLTTDGLPSGCPIRYAPRPPMPENPPDATVPVGGYLVPTKVLELLEAG